MATFMQEEFGNISIQSTRPQTPRRQGPAAHGHFAALEEPELLVDDVRAFFRPLR